MFIKTLALLVLGAAEPVGVTELSMTRIVELVGPVATSGLDANQNKVRKQVVEDGRLSVPMPGLMLFFNESGCLTAMLGQEEIGDADGKCLEGDRVPTISDFVGETSSNGKQTVIILSPLYNLAALKSIKSGRDAFWDERRVELDKLEVEVQQKNPEARLHPVYVPFGI